MISSPWRPGIALATQVLEFCKVLDLFYKVLEGRGEGKREGCGQKGKGKALRDKGEKGKPFEIKGKRESLAPEKGKGQTSLAPEKRGKREKGK